jgi:uncharacterized FlaG/YvyC family protein
MNIKSVAPNPVIPLEPKQKVDGNSRTVSTQDRDANGRQEQKEPEIKRHLSQEEFDEALKALEETSGIKSNNLTIRVEMKDDCRVVVIADSTGKVVRRLSESQLWTATRDKDRQTGKILDRAM